jgi:flagellar motor switch protein FliG
VIREIEKVLERRISSIAGQQEFSNVGGVQSVVEMLNRVDRGTEKTILETLEEENPELAEEIKRRMFVFEDIIALDDRAIQRILREVDSKSLALALKTASDELSQKMFRNMSERAAMILKEDLDFIGPVRLRDVEVAQQSIVNIVRRLEEDGEIVVSRGGEDELVI